jgi:predicted RNase H-like nuclease (RuvC/YqgF family)
MQTANQAKLDEPDCAVGVLYVDSDQHDQLLTQIGKRGNNSNEHVTADSLTQLLALKNRVVELHAETEALRQKICQLVDQKRRLRAQLSKVQRRAIRPDEEEKRILVILNKEGHILVRDLARRLRIHPTKVERLLDNLEFEGQVQAMPSIEGTFYSLKFGRKKFLMRTGESEPSLAGNS